MEAARDNSEEPSRAAKDESEADTGSTLPQQKQQHHSAESGGEDIKTRSQGDSLPGSDITFPASFLADSAVKDAALGDGPHANGYLKNSPKCGIEIETESPEPPSPLHRQIVMRDVDALANAAPGHDATKKETVSRKQEALEVESSTRNNVGDSSPAASSVPRTMSQSPLIATPESLLSPHIQNEKNPRISNQLHGVLEPASPMCNLPDPAIQCPFAFIIDQLNAKKSEEEGHSPGFHHHHHGIDNQGIAMNSNSGGIDLNAWARNSSFQALATGTGKERRPPLALNEVTREIRNKWSAAVGVNKAVKNFKALHERSARADKSGKDRGDTVIYILCVCMHALCVCMCDSVNMHVYCFTHAYAHCLYIYTVHACMCTHVYVSTLAWSKCI